MKKIITFSAAVLMACSAFAQNAALTIKNGSPCTATVYMLATDPSAPDNCGDILGNPVTLAPGTFTTYPNWNVFQTIVGWAVLTNPIPAGTTTFEWTDVKVIFSACPASWLCTPGAFGVSTPCTVSCLGAPNPNSSSCLGNTVNAMFGSACAGGGFLDDVGISIW